MYHVVVLIESKEKLCVPTTWVFAVDRVKALNCGLNRNEKRRIFYSKNLKSTPNFLLPLRTDFDPDINSCYIGKIVKTFHTSDEAKAYISKLRGGLQPVYNDTLQENTPLFVAAEEEIAQAIEKKTEIKSETEQLRAHIMTLTQQLPPVEITDGRDLSDVIILDDSDFKMDNDSEMDIEPIQEVLNDFPVLSPNGNAYVQSVTTVDVTFSTIIIYENFVFYRQLSKERRPTLCH